MGRNDLEKDTVFMLSAMEVARYQAHSVPDICAVNHPLTFLSWRDDNNSGRDNMLHSLPEAPVLPPLYSVSSVCVCPCVPVSVRLSSTLTLWLWEL